MVNSGGAVNQWTDPLTEPWRPQEQDSSLAEWLAESPAACACGCAVCTRERGASLRLKYTLYTPLFVSIEDVTYIIMRLASSHATCGMREIENTIGDR